MRSIAITIGTVLVCAVTVLPACCDPIPYEVTALETLGGIRNAGRDINDAGEATGYSFTTGDAAIHGFFYSKAEGMIDVGDLGGTDSVGNAVNAEGVVVGYSDMPGDDAIHAFLWTADTGISDLGVLAGTTDSEAWGINGNGLVVGRSSPVAFVWSEAYGMTELGTLGGTSSWAFDVNNSGVVVGGGHTPGDSAWHAFQAEGDQVGGWTFTDLDTLGGTNSEARGLNETGLVCGLSDMDDGPIHAFLWSDSGGMSDLGTLGGDRSQANDVNDYGQVVGSSLLEDGRSRAFLYQEGAMYMLNDLLASWSADWRVIDAWGINDDGVIIGTGQNSAGDVRALLLTPVPEPAILALLGSGVAVMGWWLRRRKRE